MANNYPTILIHGFFGFGEEDWMNNHLMNYFGMIDPAKRSIPYLEKKGYELYQPTLGPFTSAWDRACVLWAYIFGGTVDYGKVHAEKYGIERYGRTYPGVIKDLGQPGDHAKVNLVGHSFGGPTVLVANNLFCFGSQEERDGTPEDELSPLFKGGHGDLLHTVTTLSGVNNGTTLASCLGNKGVEAVCKVMLTLIAAVGENKEVLNFWDFYLDQYGLTVPREKRTSMKFRNPKDFKDKIDLYSYSKLNNIGHEMQIEYMEEINKSTKLNPTTYYFARTAARSHRYGRTGQHIPDLTSNDPLDLVAGFVTGNLGGKTLKKYGYDWKVWGPNDGMVNVEGQRAPYGVPSEDAASLNDDFKPGIFYNTPTEYKDHLSWTGFLEPTQEYLDYMEEMVKLFASLD